MVTFLGSLVQLCCGEGGTLQTNITGVCGECFQCLGHTGFAPAHGVCAFPVYTAQGLGCSGWNCLRLALGCMHFPGLSRSSSGTWALHKGADSVGPTFCILPRSEQLRWRGAWRAQSLRLITSAVPANRFSGCTTSAPSQVCRVSLLELISGCDFPLRMLTVQNPKKSWLAMKPACSLVVVASLGP